MGNHLKAQTVFDRYDRIRMDSSTLVNLPMTKVTGLCLPCGQTASCDAFRIRLFA